MRKKGPLWRPEIQQLIVRNYQQGKIISEILNLPEVAEHDPSEFTIRSILKHNKVPPTGKRRKRKPQLWDQENVEQIIKLRNEGNSISQIHAIVSTADNVSISRSSIVRILENFDDQVTYRPDIENEILNLDLVRQVISWYQNGQTITDILQREELKDISISSRMVRELLKSRGVKLTGKKGTLKRWPEHLQFKIVELYEDGLNFEEIKDDPEILANNPTDYAIRNILKKHGVMTRRVINYDEPIGEGRYRLYRDGKLQRKELAITHKYLAQSAIGRESVIEKMGLSSILSSTFFDPDYEDASNIQLAAIKWKNFFFWSLQYLYDDEIKNQIFIRGLELVRSVHYLRRAIKENNEDKEDRGRRRMKQAILDVAMTIDEILLKPSKMCAIEVRSHNH